MRILSAIIISLALCLPCAAQTYLVYTVKGEVLTRTTQVHPGAQLSDKTVLTIPADASLTVIDEKSSSLFSIKEGIGTIPSLIQSQSIKSRAVTTSYLAFVKDKISSKDDSKDVNYMQTAGVTYRGLGIDYVQLQAGEPGTLLDPLREAFSLARRAIADNDADLLMSVSDSLDGLGLVRYAFQTVTEYEPRSFNGLFVFDPLCLMDLAASLDSSRPFSRQIVELPVPMAPVTDNKLFGGNILCNYYVLQPGQSVEIAVDCSGYCEIAVLSMSGKVKASFDGDPLNYRDFEGETTAHIVLTNNSDVVEAVMFAINA